MDAIVVAVENPDGTLRDQRGPFAVENGPNTIPMDPALEVAVGERIHIECDGEIPWHIRADERMQIAVLQINLRILRGEIADEDK